MKSSDLPAKQPGLSGAAHSIQQLILLRGQIGRLVLGVGKVPLGLAPVGQGVAVDERPEVRLDGVHVRGVHPRPEQLGRPLVTVLVAVGTGVAQRDHPQVPAKRVRIESV